MSSTLQYDEIKLETNLVRSLKKRKCQPWKSPRRPKGRFLLHFRWCCGYISRRPKLYPTPRRQFILQQYVPRTLICRISQQKLGLNSLAYQESRAFSSFSTQGCEVRSYGDRQAIPKFHWRPMNIAGISITITENCSPSIFEVVTSGPSFYSFLGSGWYPEILYRSNPGTNLRRDSMG